MLFFSNQLNPPRKVDRVCSLRNIGGDINGNLLKKIKNLDNVHTDLSRNCTAPRRRIDVSRGAVSTCAGNVEPETAENGGSRKSWNQADLAEQSLLNKLIRRSLVRNRNQVEVLQRDPASPLYSVKTFEELRL